MIDQTKEDLKYSIYHIFDTGIEETISKHETQSLIKQHQSAIGYTNAAEMEMEELSQEEMNQLEESESSNTLIEDTMANVVVAVQEALNNK